MPEMRRGISQVLYRYTPKSMFRYNETNAWCEVTSIEMRQTKQLPPALGGALQHLLLAWDAIRSDNFPDPVQSPHRYEVGEPYQVHYTLYPLVLICRRCGRVQWYQDLDRLVARNYRLTCRGCNSEGTLTQIPYTYIHECGRSDTVYIPRHESSHTIRLVNRGRFQDSYWYCDDCGKPLTQPGRQGLGFRPCSCGPRRAMRGTTLQDPAVHFARTLSLVDTDDQILDRASGNAALGEILLSGLLCLPAYRREDLSDLLAEAPADAAATQQATAMRQILAQQIADPQQLEAMVQQLTQSVISPQAAKQRAVRDEVHQRLGANSPLVPKARASRQVLEYLYVRDHPRLQSTDHASALATARQHGDTLATLRYEEDRQIAADFGIADLRLIEAFPLLLAAVGFSRVKGSPRDRTMLRPFLPERPKIPLYTLHSSTEALHFALDPWHEAAWLIENRLVTAPTTPIATIDQLRLWLLHQRPHFLGVPGGEPGPTPQSDREAHLTLLPWERERNLTPADAASGASFGLLHTLSHMLINAAIAQVGFEADSLAEYLFPVASAGVIYASGHQEFTLGGIVSAFHLNMGYWLTSTYEAAQRCMYDPLCTARGGACHACSYLRFSCSHFNRTVSRSFLIGGPVEGFATPLIGYWTPQVRARAAALRGPSSD